MHSRQSIYPGPPGDSYWATLDSCARSLEDAADSLSAATQTLQQGTDDFARLSRVVQSRRCYELITETELQTAQRAMSNEMEPQIRELVSRAEAGIESLIKREKTIKTKLEARQQAPAPPRIVKSIPATGPGSLAAVKNKLAEAQREKARLLREMEAM